MSETTKLQANSAFGVLQKTLAVIETRLEKNDTIFDTVFYFKCI